MYARSSHSGMESIYLTEEHVALRDQVARFLAKEVEPHGEAWEEQGFVPRELLRKMGELGFFGITYPAEYGGAEADALTALVFAEAVSRTTFGGFAATVLVHTDMASPHLVNAGSREQLDKYLPAVIRGERITAVAVTEPDAGSDVAAIRTRARRDGDGWVLNGTKMFITNGVHADLYFVAARTDPEAKGSHGISMFIVEKGFQGVVFHRRSVLLFLPQSGAKRFATSSSITSVAPPPMDSTRESRARRSMALSRMYPIPPWNCWQV